MKTQKELAEQIGVTDRTIRRMSPRKRKQWQALAAQGRDVAWFDLLAQLVFEVSANSELGIEVNKLGVWLYVTNRGGGLPDIHHVTCTAELATALEYVRSSS